MSAPYTSPIIVEATIQHQAMEIMNLKKDRDTWRQKAIELGLEASEEKRIAGCCGETQFDEIQECPKCGSGDTFDCHHEADALADECVYTECAECGHQFNFN